MDVSTLPCGLSCGCSGDYSWEAYNVRRNFATLDADVPVGAGPRRTVVEWGTSADGQALMTKRTRITARTMRKATSCPWGLLSSPLSAGRLQVRRIDGHHLRWPPFEPAIKVVRLWQSAEFGVERRALPEHDDIYFEPGNIQSLHSRMANGPQSSSSTVHGR
jgi:hypothetical protein